MFTLADTPVKFVGLLVLFLFTAIWSGVELGRRQTGRQRLSNLLHLAMSLVMLAMVAQPTWHTLLRTIGMPALLGFFGIAAAWFVFLAVDAARLGRRRSALHFVGHAAMFGAMAWHLAGMAIKMPHKGPGMKDWMMAESAVGGSLWTVALVGVPFMTYLLVSSVYDLAAAFRGTPRSASHRGAGERLSRPDAEASGSLLVVAERVVATAAAPEERPSDGLLHEHVAECGAQEGAGAARVARLAGFAMNFGMFWMSTGLMVPLLPFFALLSF